MAWILILQISTYNGYMVPGYKTEADCNVAAKTFLYHASSWNNRTAFYIPSP